MTNRKGFAYKVKPADEDELDLAPHLKQDLAFCRAMVAAGYRLVELEEVRRE